MENKINIAELLKDCPSGMKLDCTMYEDVYFDYVDELNIIHCYIQHETHKTSLTFNQHGTPNSDIKSKCVIFPIGKTTWEGFVPPCKFKDGDVCYVKTKELFEYIFIFKVNENYDCVTNYVTLSAYGLYTDISSVCATDSIKEIRLATEEEKERLFDAIKANGYKWNEEIKLLEKLPKFKAGDRIKHKEKTRWVATIARVADRYYVDGHPMCYTLPFGKQDEYELVPNKFDITTLIPFESRVLVRSDKSAIWKPAIYGIYKDSLYWMVGGSAWIQCIPYSGNEHLFGTTNDCDEFYKNWK